ncbi:MAG: hypothetical protein NHF87_01010 [Candidatus Shikimatogenerans bostrichidophilus]|nr:MAG: hypothetical protein NHF87_01010 [Candidatus Shikimatogenerans bostrichidophilus]
MKLINDKRLFIIDSFIYIYKYYYYYKKFFKNKSIILGFINFILTILIEKQPTYIIVVFDGKIKKNYKKKIFINYKINRKKPPFNLKKNLLKIKYFLNLLNIPYYSIKYIEADDIIGSLIYSSEKLGYTNYIYTEDKDYYQLISRKTFIIKKKFLIDINYILEKYNINSIDQYIDLISLIGDKSDNLSGIPYIGIKTASKLLKKYNSIENIYLNINKINPIIKKRIIHYKYLVLLSKKIIKINKKIKFKKKIIRSRLKLSKNKIIEILNKIDKLFFKKKIFYLNKYI